jgi:hypothetical protein
MAVAPMKELMDSLERCLTNRDGDSACVGWPNSAEASVQDSSFLQILRQIHRGAAAVRRDAPDLAEKIEQSWHQARLLTSAQPSPILAIAGILNAGKTSLVAGFLSAAGRRRLLIGQANSQGTHRFVVWLPESWRRQPGLWENVRRQLRTIFGQEAEELSEEPAEALRQYNSRDTARPSTEAFQIPLIATDPALDAWNIGLMDCPDIQTGIVPPRLTTAASLASPPLNAWQASEAVTQIAGQRQATLQRALHVASAFVVVTSANALQDEYVERLLSLAVQEMPTLKTILAVNRVPRRYAIGEVATDVRRVYERFQLWRCYLAYHFEGPLGRERLPVLPPTLGRLAEQAFGPDLPLFFRIDHPDAAQPPAAVPATDFLVALGSQLDPGQLSHDLLRSILANLQRDCRHGLQLIEAAVAESQQRRERLQQILAEACLGLSLVESADAAASGSRLRLQVSREIVSQIGESLERTAPWWAWPGRRLTRWSENLRQWTNQVTQWVALPGWVSDRLEATSRWVRARWRAGEGARVISARAFQEQLARVDRTGEFVGEQAPYRQQLPGQLHRILERFQQESRTRLEDEPLDAYTQQLWQRMDWKQRWWTGLAPAGLLFAPLLAVVMLPMDFGGSTVLVFASLKELLFAGVAGLGMAMMNSDQMPKIAEEEAAWQQVSDLFAISCDEFAIERPAADELPRLTVDQTTRPLLPSRLPLPSGHGALQHRHFILHPEFSARLETVLSTLDQPASSGT